MAYPPVIIVDENDQEVGTAMLAEAWAKGFYHRIARIMVVDHDGRILLQRRANDMKLYPGRWDDSAAGHVDVGDTYESAAKRELAEEAGLSDVPLEPLGKFRANDTFGNSILNRFHQAYRVVLPAGAHVHPDHDEVGELKWFTADEIGRMLTEDTDAFTPDCLRVLGVYFNVLAHPRQTATIQI
ncbi:MAG TPA: NUDIX domain-containing protein [Patescibacteria group bacterium]|nr:NUDIX domain-containing protein [Patescibacteria group bacterium]